MKIKIEILIKIFKSIIFGLLSALFFWALMKFEIFKNYHIERIGDFNNPILPLMTTIYILIISICISILAINLISKSYKIKTIFLVTTILICCTLNIVASFLIYELVRFFDIYINIFYIIESIFFVCMMAAILYFNSTENLIKFKALFTTYFLKNKTRSSITDVQILMAKSLIKVAKKNNEPNIENEARKFLSKIHGKS